MSEKAIKQLQELDNWKKEIEAERFDLMNQAMQSSDPEILLKAQRMWEDVQPKSNVSGKTLIFDPLNVSTNLDYKENASSIAYGTLRKMSKTPIIRAIIGTRIEQIADFGQPQSQDHQPGFIIRKKVSPYLRGSKRKVEMTTDELKRAEYLTEFVMNCGNSFNEWTGDDFDAFLRKFTSDSLTLDQATMEVVRDRIGRPVEFFACDGALYRKAPDWNDPAYMKKYKVDYQDLPPKEHGYYPSTVQVMNTQVVQQFYPWELCFGIRNPSSNIYDNGYGTSELEDLIRIVTWMLNSDDYNGKFFSQGSSPKGILKVVGQTNEARLAEFKQQWLAMVQGVQNAWRTPVLEGDSVEWIDLQKSNNDMEFSKWQEYLIRLSCAIYKISPDEIGFEITRGSTGSNGFGNAASDNKQHSKDKGLKPLLKFIQKKLNKYVIHALDPDYELVFVGLGDDEKDELEGDIKKLSNFMTINEVREKRNLPPIEGGDIVANAVYLQGQQMAMFGDPESNEVVAEETGEVEEKSLESDPLWKGFGSFHKEMMGEDSN